MRSVILLLIGAGLGLLSTNYSMAGLMCDTRYQGNTMVSDACELGTTNNDSEAQVNADQMFGHTDWSQVWKSDDGGILPDGLITFNMDTDLLGGTFQIEWADNALGEVMFVLKDGMDDPDTYVGWLLNPGDYGLEDYDYISPFLNSNGLTVSPNPDVGLKQISHATFYYREGGPITNNNVPAPGTVMLMGLGLLAFRFRTRKDSED